MQLQWCKVKNCWPSVDDHFLTTWLKCCHHHCSIERRPKVWLWHTVTTLPAGYLMTQCQKLWTFRWHSFLWCDTNQVICVCPNNPDLYNHFARMAQCSPLIAECVTFKIVDTLTSSVMFVCIIVCFQEFGYFAISDPLLSMLSECEITWHYYIPALSAGNWRHVDHVNSFW
jgi:hypothetical protein